MLRRLILSRLLHRYALNLPARAIDSNGREYLYRMFLGERDGAKLYLHWFAGVDGERHLHSHPFEGRSVVLCGAYREEVIDQYRYELLRLTEQDTGLAYSITTRRWWNRIPANRFHRIIDAQEGTWTLFLAGKPHGRGWKFVEERERLPLKYTNAESSADRWWEKAPTLRELLAHRSSA